MTTPREPRWQNCVLHRGKAATDFFADFFASPDRRILLVAGAGFDPRALLVPQTLRTIAGDRSRAVFLREQRPSPQPLLLGNAEENIARLRALFENCELLDVVIFASDLAVIGGREAARVAARLDLRAVTDIVVDASALSRGVAFPFIRVLLETAPRQCNVHLVVVDEPETDEAIKIVACERPTNIHGFKGALGLEASDRAAVLWLPQLVPGQVSVLRQIHDSIQPRPHDVCPIMPFPASDPRAIDHLLSEYRVELLSTWQVDPRDIVYAHESDPLDLYRTIIRMEDGRRRVFQDIGGSHMVLSPVGSKLLSFGAMMAAIERDFPVMYVEALDYQVGPGKILDAEERGEIVHIWLQGEAYA
jgi:hypothetical protein